MRNKTREKASPQKFSILKKSKIIMITKVKTVFPPRRQEANDQERHFR